VSLYLDAELVIYDCRFTGNTASTGGALHAYHQSAMTVIDCWFEDNESSYEGGAVTISEGAEGTLEDCTFVANVSDSYGGGAFASYAGGSGVLRGSTFYDNLAAAGGAGAAIRLGDGANFTVENCLIAFNQDGGAVHCGTDATLSVSCSDIYGNTGGDWTGCIADQLLIPGNLAEDPGFCDTAGGNLGLIDISPCLPAFNSCGVTMGAHGAGCQMSPVELETPLVFSLSQNYPNPVRCSRPAVTR